MQQVLPVPDNPDGYDNQTGGGQIGLGTPRPNIAGKNIRVGNNITLRPAAITSAHLYNLRNQTWGIPRKDWEDETLEDTITTFQSHTDNSGVNRVYPANSDSVNPYVYPNTTNDTDKLGLRFNVTDCINNSNGTMLAPTGYFIIDALERGASRLQVVGDLETQYGYSLKVSALPEDKTPGGPSVVCEYAGRIFYSGFSGETIKPDNNSPKMSSYVLFSRIVKDLVDLTTCYQMGDPTSTETPDLLDDDGGFIRIQGAFNICGLVAAGSSLFVVAENGIWQINGGSGFAFKATDYKVSKLSNKGSISPNSVVSVGASMVYWAKDGIYTVSPDKFGDYVVQNISDEKVHNFYKSIGLDNIPYVKGIYDSYEKKVKWLIYSDYGNTKAPQELILDFDTGAYTLFEINKYTDSNYPKVIEGVQVEPFKTNSGTDSESEVKYLCIISVSPEVHITFGTYKEPMHYDWKSLDGIGLDAEAYMLTGALTGGDAQHTKAAPWITFHFLKTEDGFDLDGVPTNQSGCLVQAQWDWTNSANSNKWGRTFEAYRFKRHWMPSNIANPFDDGFYIVDFKSKLRGNGKALSLLLKSEPGKHLSIYGWSMIMDADSYV